MAKHYPQEFREEVVKVARLSQIPVRQVALDFAHLCRHALSVASIGRDKGGPPRGRESSSID